MSVPRVSVCMPVYNAERYLDQAVQSILRQTFDDLELLLLDDGSTDRSLDLARAHAAADRRVRIASYEHGGYAPLLNEGLRQARCEYFARMDADDIVPDERLERQVEYLDAHPGSTAVGTQVLIVDPDGAPIQRTSFPLEHTSIDEGNMRGRYQMHHGTLMIRTAALRAIGGYHVEFEPAEDFDLLLRLAEVGRLANLPDHLYLYRSHPNQVTVRQYGRQQKGLQAAMAQACERRRITLPARAPIVYERPKEAWQLHVVWAECALRSGFLQTARKHAIRGVALRPWSRTAWKVLWNAATRTLPGGPAQAAVSGPVGDDVASSR